MVQEQRFRMQPFNFAVNCLIHAFERLLAKVRCEGQSLNLPSRLR